MADSKLEIIITAKDNASGPLGKIGSALGGMAQIAGGFIVANLFGKIADSVTGFFSDSLSEARESIAVHKQLEQVIKSTGGVAGITAEEADKLATSLSQVTNFTDDTILSAQNMLLTFTNVGEKVFPRATETILDMSQALGQDTKSSAIQLGKALNDPIKGITALSRVGVTFTQQQKDMIKAMVEAGDIAGAQGVILDELAKEFGGSAQALADPAILLQNAWANFKETVGMSLVPILNNLAQEALPLIQQAIVAIQPHLDTFTNWIIGTGIPTLKEWGAAYLMPALDIFINETLPFLLAKAQEVWAWIQETAIPTLQNWGTAFSENIVPVIQDFVNNILPLMWTKAQEIWTWITSTAIPIIQEWATTISETLVIKFAELQGILDNFTLEILPLLQEAWIALSTVWREDIGPALAELWTALEELFIELGFGTGQTDALTFALDLLKFLLKSVTTTVETLTPIIRALGDVISFSIGMTQSMVEGLSAFKRGLDGVYGIVSDLIGKIEDMSDKLSGLSVPDWLIPGSPTPFELGLKGIGNAIKNLPELQSTFNVSGNNPLGASPKGFGGMGMGGSPVVVNLTYSPVVSTADKFTLEKVLTEVVNDINRKRLSG